MGEWETNSQFGFTKSCFLNARYIYTVSVIASMPYGFLWPESHAVAKKPHDTAAVFLGLKFANNIQWKGDKRLKRWKPWKSTFWITPLVTTPLQGTPTYIRINLILLETRLILWETELLGYIFVADSIGLSSLKFSWWAPKDEGVLKQSA